MPIPGRDADIDPLPAMRISVSSSTALGREGAPAATWQTSGVLTGLARRALVVVLVGVSIAACTSTPPAPSAGTSTPTPQGSVAMPAASAVPASLATATAVPTPISVPTLPPTPTPVPTPVHTMPPVVAVSAELVKPGKLNVCLALMGAPASSLDNDGNAEGYNVAFASAIAARLGLNPVIQQPVFGEIPSDLAGHSCDISVSSQNITADRLAQMNLIPYTQSKQGFPVVVGKGNPDSIDTLADLCGQKVSAATGTTSVDVVNGTGQYAGSGVNDGCQVAGQHQVDLHTYDTELDAVQALLDGTVVAYLGNVNYVSQYSDLIEASLATLPSAVQGISVALDHPNLTAAVESALGTMITDGTYVQVLGQYLSPDAVNNISIAN